MEMLIFRIFIGYIMFGTELRLARENNQSWPISVKKKEKEISNFLVMLLK